MADKTDELPVPGNAEHHSYQPGPVPLIFMFGIIASCIALTWIFTSGTSDELISPKKNDITSNHQSTSTPNRQGLPKEEAKYLQDVEHLGGFVFGDRALPKLADAIELSEISKVREFFSASSRTAIFENEMGLTIDHSGARITLWSEPDQNPTPCNRDQLAERLIGYRNEFDELVACKLKVMLMSPIERNHLDGPWTGTCKLRLAGMTHEGQLLERVIKFRCDVDQLNDDTPDQRGWITRWESYESSKTLANDFLMEDITADTGIKVNLLRDNWLVREQSEETPFITGGIFLADYNQDGWMDALVTDFNGNFLYQGIENGKFLDVTRKVGLTSHSKSQSDGVVFMDIDGDGFEDLLIGNKMYSNEQGKQFRLLSENETSLRLPQEAHQFAIADYDKDGHLDLYVTGTIDRSLNAEEVERAWIDTKDGLRNQLWRNLGNWQFEDVTDLSGTAGNGAPAFAAVWFDANGDTWPDLMTACEIGPNDYYVNQGDGTFQRGELPKGYGGFSMGITVGDIDNDGFGDPYVANMYSKAGERIIGNLKPGVYPPDIEAKIRDFVTGNELYHNLGDGHFERIGKSSGMSDVGWAYGVGYMDLDNDGFLDLYAPVGFQSVNPDKPDG